MAKGSVRKKGKKWYYRFYVENESGNLVQKEYAGTESKSETEAHAVKGMGHGREKSKELLPGPASVVGPRHGASCSFIFFFQHLWHIAA